jgi:uncharacterized protein YuzE
MIFIYDSDTNMLYIELNTKYKVAIPNLMLNFNKNNQLIEIENPSELID